MSNAGPKPDIEDVLSSIRRLVSEDGALAAGRQAAAMPGAGRLVLTPALRVAGGEAEPDEAADFAAPDQRASEREEADEPATSGAQGGEDAAQETGRESLERKIAELEAMIGAKDEEWDPEGSAEDRSGTGIEALPWEDYDEDAEADEEADAVTEAAADEQAGDAETGADDDYEPEPEPEPQEAGVPWEAQWQEDPEETWQSEAPAPQDARETWQGAGRTASRASWEDDDGPDLLADETLLDEETLRDMVAQIVRQELQGELGERITRNVRKLVRREIQRALAAQDFE